MRRSHVLALVLAASAAAAACTADVPALGGGKGAATDTSGTANEGVTQSSSEANAPGSGTAKTNSETGKAFFAASVHPFLAAKCAGCHEAGGIGNPTWLVKTEAAKTYENVYTNGWVIPVGSRMLDKGVHASGGAPALTDAEKATFLSWVAMEVKDGGQKAQVNVLEKFGDCLDPALFAQIGLEKLVTTRRTKDNNANAVTPWDENANECTGCNAAPCRTCHSLDDATGFVMALGNPNVPAAMTFEETKKILPPYLQKYVSTGPDGKPAASNGLEKKADATRRDRAYTHPMFTIPTDVKTKLDAFVSAAIAKYAAGQCGK
jgi:hypothetical protein